GSAVRLLPLHGCYCKSSDASSRGLLSPISPYDPQGERRTPTRSAPQMLIAASVISSRNRARFSMGPPYRSAPCLLRSWNMPANLPLFPSAAAPGPNARGTPRPGIPTPAPNRVTDRLAEGRAHTLPRRPSATVGPQDTIVHTRTLPPRGPQEPAPPRTLAAS